MLLNLSLALSVVATLVIALVSIAIVGAIMLVVLSLTFLLVISTFEIVVNVNRDVQRARPKDLRLF